MVKYRICKLEGVYLSSKEGSKFKMKKLLKIVLLVVMLCVLVVTMTGCGTTDENQTNNTVNNTTETPTVEFSRGEWVENQYNNDFAKIKFNLPEGWVKATDDQIAQLMNVGKEMLNQDQKKLAELAEETTVYGMSANNPNNASSMMIIFEKPILKVTPEYYLKNVKQQLEALTEMDYTVGEQYTTDIAGEQYYVTDAKVEGYNIEQSYYVKAEGDYIIGIIITSTEEGQRDIILNNFE